METATSDFRTILAELAVAARKEKVTRGWLSHKLAKSFIASLESEGARIVETGTGNANYFCASIEAAFVAISPFGSHEGFWEKLSVGFRALKDRHLCRWGVVLFVLPEKRGVWIEGNDYDDYILKGREKVHLFEVSEAERRGVAHSFGDAKEFVELITKGPKVHAKTVLIKKPISLKPKGES
jgi:hypothetical protein